MTAMKREGSPDKSAAPGSPKKVKIDGSASASASSKPIVMWFRSDLRIHDNTALHAAACLAGISQSPLVALFVLSPGEWLEHDLAPIKVFFMLRSLEILRDNLQKLNIPLIVVRAETRKDVPQTVTSVVRTIQAQQVFCNKEYEVNEGLRDAKVNTLLSQATPAIPFRSYHDQCVVEPGIVRTKDGGRVYTVFTPFKNSWIELVAKNPQYAVVHPAPVKQVPVSESLAASIKNITLPIPDTVETHPVNAKVKENAIGRFPPGEQAGLSRLESFAKDKIQKYKQHRDQPDLEGTSALSPYLAIGLVSARQCLAKAREANGGKMNSGNEGPVVWISEIIWREFYRNILAGFPFVCKNKPFKPETDKFPWVYDDEKFQKWCDGKTGFPIVDAGMRQLKETGWMHNRLRMVTAMFLTKDLAMDWRQGERYFMRNLIDGDFASNNGGWQWSASTGTDSQPYFRVFNPTLQSERFDPDGRFIKKHVPELQGVPGGAIHEPKAKLGVEKLKKTGYPAPMVDHKVASKAFVEAFKIAVTKKP
ncbi:hypothetical protein HDV05_004826 [Chytridiales sp. JEL 0842]|nr:hypothetical protein HDV05_004826 [Chytridiales sp. JEL 0842]